MGGETTNLNEDSAGVYLPLQNDDRIINDSDDSRLKQLGYKQELSRTLSLIANFSVTFSIVSILTGLTTMFSSGLTYGGPVTMVYGWPVVGMLTLAVGMSMAEICSAYPTSGGLYFWSARLCGKDWGPFASWLTGCPYSAGLGVLNMAIEALSRMSGNNEMAVKNKCYLLDKDVK